MARILILGAGFGGLTVATELRRRLDDDHEIVLLDRRELFLMGLRKLWALVGLGSLEDGRRSRAALNEHGIQFLQRTITTIDPEARRVVTDGGALAGDYLVVALGAEPRPDLVPGLSEHAHNLYDGDQIPALRDALARFDGGRLAIVVAGVPYKCPPAPYECSMLLDEHLRERGVRDDTQLIVTTLQPMLMPNAGKEGSVWLGEQLKSRRIEFHVNSKVQRVESGRVVHTTGELEADLIIGVPPHRAPAVVKASGLTNGGEWIAIDPATLATPVERVYAIGDVTQITLANGLPLPKAGLFAEREGQRVAAAIVSEIRGEANPAPFDGRGYCFVEMGKSAATRVTGEFFAHPEPRIGLEDVSAAHAEEKHAFEAERLARWFGG